MGNIGRTPRANRTGGLVVSERGRAGSWQDRSDGGKKTKNLRKQTRSKRCRGAFTRVMKCVSSRARVPVGGCACCLRPKEGARHVKQLVRPALSGCNWSTTQNTSNKILRRSKHRLSGSVGASMSFQGRAPTINLPTHAQHAPIRRLASPATPATAPPPAPAAVVDKEASCRPSGCRNTGPISPWRQRRSHCLAKRPLAFTRSGDSAASSYRNPTRTRHGSNK